MGRSRKKKVTRVLLTDGRRTIDLFWLTHTGTDVYWGMSGTNRKTSYHESGKVHTKEGDVTTAVQEKVPLREIKGWHIATSIGVNSEMLEHAAARYDYAGGSTNASLVVDVRSFPKGVGISIVVGLLGSRNYLALDRAITSYSSENPTSTKQVLISTETDPWVFAILSLWDTDHPLNKWKPPETTKTQ